MKATLGKYKKRSSYDNEVDFFMSRVILVGSPACWIWAGKKNKSGYGSIRLGGRQHRAHRIAYQMFVGELKQGMEIMHLCDEPSCVNPEHLRQGTHDENMADMKTKGRAATGIKHGSNTHPEVRLLAARGVRASCHKLTEQEVLEIRSSLTVTQTELANRYGVSQYAIWAILHRKRWKHL